MESTLALAAVRAVNIPLTLLSALNIAGDVWPRRVEVANNTCFDYLIVGAGTAGCIIANRLSENPNITVGVLEAGDDPPITAFFPLTFPLLPDTPADWDYYSTLNPYSASAQRGDRTKLTAGKMLGGSSSLNHFINLRATCNDYKIWAKIVNDLTWNYKVATYYSKKSENLTDPVITKSKYAKYHGFDGPMKLDRMVYEEANDYLTSFGEVGNKIKFDLNGYNSLGYAQALLTLSGGLRQSTSFTYLSPIRDRTNLFVLRNTLVTKILFDNNRRAYGVKAVRNNQEFVYTASKEIILCAGVFNTPQILMLSGIGPREHLESFNIPVIEDMPVGDNWQDQVSVTLVHKMAKSIIMPPALIPTILPFPIITGLVSTKGCNYSENQSSGSNSKNCEYGDYQTFSLVFPADSQLILLTCAIVFGYKPEICDTINIGATGRISLYTVLAQLRPYSKGFVRLKSADPFDDPEITTNFLKDPRDIDDLVKYIKKFIQVTNSTYFTDVNSELIDLKLPQCQELVYGSDEFWRCYVLNTAFSPYHATSSCPAGTITDGKFRVKNFKNLRIVDASVIPELPSGNPYAVVIMLAEKASDDIKRCANSKPTCSIPALALSSSDGILPLVNVDLPLGL